MKNKNLILILFILLSQMLNAQSKTVYEGKIRIKFRPEFITSTSGLEIKTVKGEIKTGIESIDKLNSAYVVTEMKRVFPYSPKFEERHMRHGLHLWYQVSYGTKAPLDEIVEKYANAAEIEISEFISIPALVDGSGEPKYISKSDISNSQSKSMPFDDPMLERQWHYNNTGQTGGIPGADINLFDAWEISTGSPNVTVAVMDQGVQYDHEDLENVMWVNELELNGSEGIDDDQNGYIDDIHGVNFADNTGYILMDYHGTHVAGTIAAQNNNGMGVSGIAGGSGNNDAVRIMTCQILGGNFPADIPNSYVYAADMGANISQNSWGYQSIGYNDQATLDGIDYFIAEAGNYSGSPMKGGIVIFASGNLDTEQLMYPGAYDPVLTVNSMGSDFVRAEYSNYGTWTDIIAPGGNLYNDSEFGTTSDYSNGVLSTLDFDSYGYLEGTSMACPHVSGIAALIVSKYGGSNFTNTDLETHILTGYKDIYQFEANKPYEGKLGKGYIDAMLALAHDNGFPPKKIADLQLTGISQDFATLQWTVPSDPDDALPVSFEIIYSKETITLDNLQYAHVLSSENKDSARVIKNYTINNLNSLTNYNFAVRSLDRWGNISALSNIVNETTNSGPIASLDPLITELSITIDVTQNTIGKDSIDIFNAGEGVLKWDALNRMIEAVPLSTRPDFEYPKLLNPSAVHHGILGFNIPEVLNNIQRDTLADATYLNESLGLMVIGESNLEIPNSSATRYYVGKEKGFNLTQVDAYLNLDSIFGPIVLEVYTGYNISNAKLIHAQEYKLHGQRWYYLSLNQQLFFEQGTYFWVVIHTPSGNAYPLGAGIEIEDEYSKNSYMSLDGGGSWKMFEELYHDNRMVWAQAVVSGKVYLGDYITLQPSSGNVAMDQSEKVVASVDGTNMINGTYKNNLVFNINETGKPMLQIPINVNITGHLPKITSQKRIDFGGVIIGNSREITVNIENNGLGRFQFKSPNFVFTDSQFEYSKGLISNFEALTSQEVSFKFTPIKAGNNYSDVTLIDENGNDYTFELFGAGLEPPIINIDPETINYDNLTIGDSIQGSFYISNLGKYPLDYFIPANSDGSNMEVIPSNIPKFGYTYSQDTTGADFVWNDISTTGTNISKEFSSQNLYFKLSLNFLFPFYGKNENELFITNSGVITFTEDGSLNSISPYHFKYDDFPSRYISGCGFPMNIEDAGYGNIYYKQGADHIIVQYEHVPFYRGLGYDNNSNPIYTYITFQMVLFDNGDIKLYYKDAYLDRYESQTLIAMEDKEQNDGILILGKMAFTSTQYSEILGDFGFQPNSTIQIFNPGMGLFSNVTNPYGTIKPGDSTQVEYKIKTDSLFLLPYKEKLVIASNDPQKSSSIHTVNFNITGGGVSNLIPDTSGFDFGTLFKDDVKTNTFYVYNEGAAVDSILSVSFDNNNFTVSGNIPEIFKPERKLPYTISINTSSIGAVEDTLRMFTKNGQIIKIGLKGEVIQGPIMTLKTTSGSLLSSITKILTAGTSITQNFNIENSGPVDLEVAPVRNSWTDIQELTPSGNVSNYTYDWKTSNDFGGPAFNWVEIVENGGTRIPGMQSYLGPVWSEGIKLPFTFNFYGNDYDTLYIGINGLITFTKDQNDYKYFFGYGQIPNAGQPDNFIAPLFFGFGGQGFTEYYPLSDPYYKLEDDRIIIEYKDFNSVFMLDNAISFQVILYPNGKIRFQYLIAPENKKNALTPYGVVGVENIDGTQGIQITNRSRFINSAMAIDLYPVRSFTIAPDETKDFTIDISAEELIAGTYQDSLKFLSNDALAKNKKLPLKLIITGSPEISKPDTLSFGHVFVDPELTKLVKEFEIKNVGTDNFILNSASHTLTSEIKIEAYVLLDEIWQWVDIYATNPALFPRTFLAQSSLKIRVTINTTTPGELIDELVLSTNLPEAQQIIKIMASIYNPPIIDYANDTISYYAETKDFQKSTKIGINNLGNYNLDYNLRINYQRNSTNSEEIASTNSFNYVCSPTLLPKFNPIDNRVSKNTTQANTKEFTQVLAHETATEATSNLGYGGTYPFHTATGFYAPTEGFNLTHVQTWYIPMDWLDAKIRVNIYGGDENIHGCSLLYSETFNHVSLVTDNDGELITFELSQNIEFFPNEKFFVEFVYDIEAFYPQGCTEIANDIANRFMFGAGDGWYDLSTYDDYKNIGFIIRAAQETASSSPWVILSSEEIGSIAPSETDSLQIDFDAFNAENGNNYAYLTINSNDIASPERKIVLHLRKNQGPVFDAIDNLTVIENDTLEFKITATDIEGSDFSIEIDGDYPFLEILSVTNNSSSKVFDFTEVEKIALVRYTPDYKSEGKKEFRFKSTDELGNMEYTTISIDVKNVNRSPEPIALNTLGLSPSGSYVLLSVYDIFNDPDYDIISFSAVVSNTAVIELFNSSTEFMVIPIAGGTSKITFVATDAYGATATNTLDVDVSNLYTGDEDIINNVDLNVYPNPSSGMFNVELTNELSADAEMIVSNMVGTIVYRQTISKENATMNFNLNRFPDGIYFILIRNEKIAKTIKIIKQ